VGIEEVGAGTDVDGGLIIDAAGDKIPKTPVKSPRKGGKNSVKFDMAAQEGKPIVNDVPLFDLW
jgi:hypothetical protein